MFERLRDQVFGLNEFEKVSIEDRFNEIYEFVDELEVNNLIDFENLEESIYKIKDLLRLKSSNLYKAILTPNKPLTKKKVYEIIDKLENIKIKFLNKAFTVLNENSNKKEVLVSNLIPNTISETQNIESEKPKLEEQEVFNKNEVNLIENDFLIKSNEQYKILLENGKVPFILINFTTENYDFGLLKQLSSIFFEEYSCQGTNIISEDNRFLIIPRFLNDEIFEMPQIQCNVQEVFEKIKNFENGSIEEIKEEIQEPKFKEGIIVEKQENNDEIFDKKSAEKIDERLSAIEGLEHKPVKINEEYLQITEKNDPKNNLSKKNSTKENDESLDALIKKDLEEAYYRPKINPFKEDEVVQFIPEKDKTEIIEDTEKKIEVKEEPADKIELIQKTDEYEKEILSMENYEIYRDDKIFAYFREDSKILGELVVKTIDGTSIKDLSESDISYMTIFSKVFSSILFEGKGAHGTNLIFDFNNNFLTIIPRNNNDGLKLDWELKQESDSFLDDLKAQLLAEMNKSIDKPAEEKKPVIEPINEEKSEKKKKAELVLEALTRIP